jgi:ATP-dependent helicase YprA (DUF1998 family)
MRVTDIEHLDTLTDDQLWEAAANMRNMPEIRQQAILRWLFPDETDADEDPDELSGGRLLELRRRASVLDSDEAEEDEDEMEEMDEMAPYFDTQGRLILTHDGVSYLIESLDDEGAYDGITTKDDLYTTDDKTNMNTDI